MPNIRQKYARTKSVAAVTSTPVNSTAKQAKCNDTNGTHLTQFVNEAFRCGRCCHNSPAGGLTRVEVPVLMKLSLAGWFTILVLPVRQASNPAPPYSWLLDHRARLADGALLAKLGAPARFTRLLVI